MHYIVTGCDGKLGGRTAELMLQKVAPADLTFTCPFLDRLDPEKKARWESLGVKVCQANYDDPDEMVQAFAGGDRIFIVSAVTIGEIRVRQHKNVVDAAIAAGVTEPSYIMEVNPIFSISMHRSKLSPWSKWTATGTDTLSAIHFAVSKNQS